jgi:hypothetical protein
LLAAISAVKSGCSIREVGRAYKIAGFTFRFRMESGITSTAQLCRKAIFAPDQEQKLNEPVLSLSRLLCRRKMQLS